MSERRVTKIKINREKSKVAINWEEKDGLGNWGKYTLDLSEPALPDFVQEYSGLKENAAKVLELKEYDTDDLDVTAINYNFVGEDDVMAATISIWRELKNSLGGVSETTPLKYTDHVFEGDADPRSLFNADTIEKLVALQGLALAYVDGERAQGELFDRGEDDQKSDTAADENGGLVTADVAEDEEPF